MFNRNRLIIARKRRKLSCKQLAERVEVSPVTITRLEKGDNEPEEITLNKISQELGFPLAFFEADDLDIPTKDSASFRSLTAMTAREREAALTAGSLAFSLADWVADRFNTPDVDLMDFSHETTPEVAARMLRDYWGLGERPVSNVVKLLEAKGIRVFSLSENTKNVDAFSCWRNGVPYMFLNTYKTAEHSRFDAAHELGHLVLHRHGEAKGRQAENEANQFASYFLIPESDLLSKLPRVSGVDQLIKAKKRWGVSVAALAYRSHKSGLISDWVYRSLCIQINKRFGKTEPNGLAKEKSVVWDHVFKDLWASGVSKDKLAKELCIPVGELENLVFGLIGVAPGESPDNKFPLTPLKLV